MSWEPGAKDRALRSAQELASREVTVSGTAYEVSFKSARELPVAENALRERSRANSIPLNYIVDRLRKLGMDVNHFRRNAELALLMNYGVTGTKLLQFIRDEWGRDLSAQELMHLELGQ